MRIGLPAFVGLALSACAAAADPLPPAFDGVWDVTSAACAYPDSTTRLGVAGARLQYYEWGGEVLSARPEAGGSVQIEMDWWSVDDTDANEQPIIQRRTGKLTLSPDRSRLTVAIEGGDSHYVRCSRT